MKNIPIKNIVPYAVAIVIFIIITMVYFNPLLQGKKIRQDDITRHKGMSKEIVDFREKTGDEALWTNSMFGGMPAYQISVKYKSNLISYFDKIFRLGLPHPAAYVFLYFIGFFILLLVLGVDPWLSFAGSIAFAFSSYFFIIIEAGHNSKAHAIGYMAPVLAGMILCYRGKYLWGGILTALFLALELRAGHPQITYYLLIIAIILGIYEFVNAIKEKKYIPFLRSVGVLIIAALLAVLTHSTNLWATYEYGKYTIRGKSELTSNLDNKTTGLDKDYATAWSYGVPETFSLMIPNTKGGATGVLGNNKKVMKDVDRQFKQAIAGQNHYWGNQPFTSGPVYVGAIIVFLFVLGIFIVPGRLKWVLVSATVLSIFLSWGKNFMPLTDFFLDYIPGYNKFRAVSMTLVIAELCMPLLAILTVNEIFRNPGIIKEKQKQFFIAFGLTGGLALIFYLVPSLFFNFLSNDEIIQFDEVRKSADPNQLSLFISNLEQARISIFKADAIRSFFFILLGGLVLWLYSMKKIGWKILVSALAILFLIDMTTICYRYLNNENFVRKSKVTKPYQASAADKEIFKDTNPDFRVLNIAVNTFNDASTSYFHKSIGGYHGAKLRRYQELIDHQISSEKEKIVNTLTNNPTLLSINNTLGKLPVLNMLNTKYIIYDPARIPLINNSALGNAWFVENYKIVDNADEEIAALNNFNPDKIAIVDKRFEDQLTGKKFESDSLSAIKLTEYQPNHLVYSSKSSDDQLAVFSEIYYDKGWNAYIDGKPAPYFRADYVLRAMIVPAGDHTIEFKFEPKVYKVGENISLISSILLILLLIGGLYYEIRKNLKSENKI